MQTLNDVHYQFASFFPGEVLQPYAYLLSKKLSEGHICLPLETVSGDLHLLPAALKERFREEEALLKDPLVSSSTDNKQPFILYNRRLYLQRYFQYESMILQRILTFIESEKTLKEGRMAKLRALTPFIRNLFKPVAVAAPESFSYSDWQLAAAMMAVINNFAIITGGPGTGKTTTVARILAILFSMDQDLKVALAAPTGKAAARMAESLKNAQIEVPEETAERFRLLEPATIHRLLRYIPDSPYFKHNGSNPLHYDVVIVDESSMIDVALFAKLLDAIGPQTRLILLGDKDQLASVEAGSLFGDICLAQSELNVFSPEQTDLINSFMDASYQPLLRGNTSTVAQHPMFEHLVELRVSHRFKGDEGIGKLSRAVINGDRETLKAFIAGGNDTKVLIDTAYQERIFTDFVKGYDEYILEPDIRMALRKFNRLRILCSIRDGEQGLNAVNRRVERYLSGRRLLDLKGEFYEHRPVMITRNDYTLGLFNGDIGIIRRDEAGVLKAWFEDSEGGLKPVLPGLITQAETVYAMTIHKSQGSEFDRVLIILPQSEGIEILTSELLYTGITRAKAQVLIQGNEALILNTAGEKVKRASGILQRFNTASKERV